MKFITSFLFFGYVSLIQINAQLLQNAIQFDNSTYGSDISKDGQIGFIAGKDSTATIWYFQKDEQIRLTGHLNSVSSIDFYEHKKTVLTGAYDNQAILWGLDGRQMLQLKGHTNGIISVAQSDYLLATASRDHTSRLWDRRGNLIRVLEGHTDQVNAIEFIDKGTKVVTASNDGTLRFWDLRGKQLSSLSTDEKGIRCFSLSTDGSEILLGHTDGSITIADQKAGNIRTLEGHTGMVGSIQWINSSNSFVSAGADGKVKFWNRKGKLLSEFIAHEIYVYETHVSGNFILSTGGDGQAKLWRMKE